MFPAQEGRRNDSNCTIRQATARCTQTRREMRWTKAGNTKQTCFNYFLLSFPTSCLGVLGMLGSVTKVHAPFLPLHHCLALPSPYCLPGAHWSVQGAELLALGCRHGWTQAAPAGAGQMASRLGCILKTGPKKAFVLLPRALLSGLVFPGPQWVPMSRSSPGVLGMSDTGDVSMVGDTCCGLERCRRPKPWEKLDRALKF